MLLVVVVIGLGIVAGYIFGKNALPDFGSQDVALQRGTKAQTTPTEAALAAFSSEKYSIGFSYPDTWSEGTSASAAAGMEKVAAFGSGDFSDTDKTDIKGVRVVVERYLKKQAKESALAASVVAQTYETVLDGTESKVGDAAVKIWQYRLLDGKAVMAIAKVFVEEGDSYVLIFTARTADDFDQFTKLVQSMTFTKKESSSTSGGSKKPSAPTPTPLPTNASFFEGR